LAGDPGGLTNWFTLEWGATNNVAKWDAPDVVQLMSAAAIMADQEARAEIYKEVDRIVNEELPMVRMVRGFDLVGVNTRVANFVWSKSYWFAPNLWFVYGG
jgi:ABC-type transport system substrate-binding protein